MIGFPSLYIKGRYICHDKNNLLSFRIKEISLFHVSTVSETHLISNPAYLDQDFPV